MTAVWLVLRAGLRQRWRSWLALALLAGLFGGVVTAAAAGARRTDSAYPRLLDWSRGPDVEFFYSPLLAPVLANLPMRVIAGLPQAAATVGLDGFTVLDPAAAEVIAPETTLVPGSFWRRKILAGRLPDPRRADEVNISFLFAQASGWRVGQTRILVMAAKRGTPVPVRLRVTGIDAAPQEFPPQTGLGTEVVWVTPAFYRQYHTVLDDSPAVALRLRRGASLSALLREVSRLARGKAANAYPLGPQAASVERALHLQAVALWLLAGLLAAVGLLTLGQLQARQAFLEAVGHGTLRSLGMSRRQLLAAGLARAAVTGAGAGAAALVLAVALSPVFPLGLARTAEPEPGLRADWLVLSLGLVGVLAGTVGCAAWPAWRAAAARAPLPTAGSGPEGRPRRPALWRALGGLRSVPGQLGVRLALSRGAGRTALPVATTIAGAAIGVAALSVALVFSASLTHLLATPRLYGVTWDADVSNLAQEAGASGIVPAIPAVARDPDVAAWAAGYAGAPLQIGRVPANAIVLGPGRGGSLLPVPIEGRLPTGPGQVALGARTLAAVGSRIGGAVTVRLASSRAARFTIVGVAVFPSLSDSLALGQGADFTLGGLLRLLPPGARPPAYDTLLVLFRPGASQQGQIGALTARLDQLGPYTAQPPALPTDLVNFGQVHDMPLLLGGTLGALALLTIAHLLVTSVRRRRGDLAVLRTLGFTSRQVRATVSWQAGTLVAAALGIGIPVGIVGGRVAWRVLSHQLGIVPVPITPAVTFGLLVPGALALAVAVAALPGELAARARPARDLRAE